MNRKLISTLLLAVLAACSPQVQEQVADTSTPRPLIDKPFEALQLSVQIRQIEVAQQTEWQTTDGTRIVVPADAFETTDGQPVQGKVELEYVPVRSAGEIIASGLPMDYSENGIEGRFETAGMFKLSASQNGQELKLRSGKSIAVDMPSDVEGEFNFYYFDATKGHGWQAADGTPVLTENKPTQTAQPSQADLERLQSIPRPAEFDPNKDEALDVLVDYSSADELKSYRGLMWRFNEKPTAELQKKINSTKWTQVALNKIDDSKTDLYRLRLKNGAEIIELDICPIYRGKNYQLALASYQKAQEELAIYAQRNEQQLVENRFVRSFNVAQLGWCNWDTIAKDRQLTFADANFSFGPNISQTQAENAKVFVVAREGRSVVRFVPETYAEFNYNPETTKGLVAILPDGTVAKMPGTELNNAAFAPGIENRQARTFSMTVLPEKANSTQSLDAIVATL